MAQRKRSFTALELAIAFSLLASFLVIAVPAFVRDLHASYLVEPVDGVHKLAQSALEHSERAHARTYAALPEGASAPPAAEMLPASAPLTPADVPRGVLREDPRGTWDHATWQALAFRATRPGVPHAYSFAFENQGQVFSAVARGDLDGDGVQSLFEVHGRVSSATGDEHARIEPGMYVEAELE
jgi:type II secretory pathway pseudopilin PulG